VGRSTRTGLLVAIILLLAGGVATAVVRETRDESSTEAAPDITVPDVPRPSAEPLPPAAPPTAPTTAAVAAPTSGAPAPTTVASPAGEIPSPSSGAAPTSTVPPVTAMPNTGGQPLPALGVLLVAVGLLGRRLSGGKRLPG
jgi:hypothetical protein